MRHNIVSRVSRGVGRRLNCDIEVLGRRGRGEERECRPCRSIYLLRCLFFFSLPHFSRSSAPYQTDVVCPAVIPCLGETECRKQQELPLITWRSARALPSPGLLGLVLALRASGVYLPRMQLMLQYQVLVGRSCRSSAAVSQSVSRRSELDAVRQANPGPSHRCHGACYTKCACVMGPAHQIRQNSLWRWGFRVPE